ncbi:oligosaccharide flippase family protein [Nonomuraea wenchangensis]|uniref:Polysaccharide biosynthesis protein n=1 Tax=Nonomuraea wenchangensis TaxID=568860 RepID=A0A1I0J3V3_9ACTN|nr:oligosaccharide flippase family protein [Nonomuraea wenchangensis]SEU04502.1 Polysaccharide biosynthesis protein [Nonomuraea wenchangensis]
MPGLSAPERRGARGTGAADRVRGWLAAHRWAAGPTLVSTLASGIAAATTLVIARGAGAAAFGDFTVVLSIALIVTVGMLTSLHYVMLQELPRAAPEERPALLTTALLATLAVSAALAGLALLAAPLLTAALNVDTGTLAAGLALAASMTVNQLAESFLRGLKRFAFVAWLKLAVALCYLGAACYCLLVLGVREAEPYLAALIVTNAGFAVVAVAAARPRLGAWSARLAGTLYRHGGWVTAIAALSGLLFGVDVIFLNHWAPAADVGVYSVYNGFPKRLMGVVFTDGIGLALLPIMATTDKPLLMRRIARLAPAVAAATAVLSFAASLVFFLLMRGAYPYAPELMALSALGIGLHTAFNLYGVALSMDGVRGAKVLAGCLLVSTPPALAVLAVCVRTEGLTGGLVGFALVNLVLLAVVATTAARRYRS